jgi:hypothetical protein
MMKDYRKKSSYELTVEQEPVNSKDYETQLGLI